MIRIKANVPCVEPPQWAILERSLIDLMDDVVEPVMQRLRASRRVALWPTTENFQSIDGLDDAYESFHN